MKSKKIYISLGLGLILLLGILAYFFGIRQSVITYRSYDDINRIPINTGNFNLGEYIGTYETLVLGSVSCSGYSGSYYCYGSNGNLDRSSYFSNSLSDGETLIIESKIGGDDDNFENYIETKITLPAGKITGFYSGSATFSNTKASNYASVVVFEVDRESYSKPIQDRATSYSFSDNFEIILEEEKEVKFKIITKAGQPRGTNAEGTLTIYFEPKMIIISTFDYYRFSENSCYLVNIKISEKTENDYSTLEGCQNNILVEEDEIIVYRLENNACNLYTVVENEKLSSDYTSLNKCKNSMGETQESKVSPIIYFLIGGGIILLTLIILIFSIKPKRKKK